MLIVAPRTWDIQRTVSPMARAMPLTQTEVLTMVNGRREKSMGLAFNKAGILVDFTILGILKMAKEMDMVRVPLVIIQLTKANGKMIK